MALHKAIELENGVVVNYHRIVTITKVTNFSVILEIASYIDQSKREQEMQQIESGEDITVYQETSFLSLDYDETANITDWYDYLKTTEKYNGATDA